MSDPRPTHRPALAEWAHTGTAEQTPLPTAIDGTALTHSQASVSVSIMVAREDDLWDELASLRTALAAQTTVESCVLPSDEWRIDGGVMRHVDGGFFEIVGFVGEEGRERVLLRQRETALVGLIVRGAAGMRSFLLNARCEPGLHGVCQFSTTIQSTPSNYERRHRGAATPFIDVFLRPDSAARLLHDSLEYDWGQYYDGKRKRFLILEVDELLTAASPRIWVPEVLLRRMLFEDFWMTGDLRVAVALLDARDRGSGGRPVPVLAASPFLPGALLRQAPLDELASWIVDDHGIREREPHQGVSVEYVHTRSASREVVVWSQPLLRVRDEEWVRLWSRLVGGKRRFAVERRTQLGLAGRLLYFPAAFHDPGALVYRTVHTSAEGGRFLRHEVVLELAGDRKSVV